MRVDLLGELGDELGLRVGFAIAKEDGFDLAEGFGDLFDRFALDLGRRAGRGDARGGEEPEEEEEAAPLE